LERGHFEDLDVDGRKELAVGWGGLDKIAVDQVRCGNGIFEFCTIFGIS